MIIYDIVEAVGLLQNYWPVSGSNGRVLTTTRNHLLGFDPADSGLEIFSSGADTGFKFLLHLPAGHICEELLVGKLESPYNLSERLSGHSSALSNICGLIHRGS